MRQVSIELPVPGGCSGRTQCGSVAFGSVASRKPDPRMAAVIARMAKSATSSPMHQNFRLSVRKLADFQFLCSAVSKGRRSTYIRSERRRLRHRILVAARDRPLVDDFDLYRNAKENYDTPHKDHGVEEVARRSR